MFSIFPLIFFPQIPNILFAFLNGDKKRDEVLEYNR